MSTSEPTAIDPAALTSEIERAANEMFQAPPMPVDGPSPDCALNPPTTAPPGGGLSSPSLPSEVRLDPTPSAARPPAMADGGPYFLALVDAPERALNPPTTAPPGGGLSSPSVPSEWRFDPTPHAASTPVADDASAPDFVPLAETPDRALSLEQTLPAGGFGEPFAPITPYAPGTTSQTVTAPEPTANAPLEPQLVAHAPGKVDIFDAHAVKRDFPILHQNVHGKQLVWLDNAATTQKPNAVIERIDRYYRHENSNVHRAAHTLAARATDAYEGSRQTVRRFLNAGTSEEIIFVRGATEGINLIAKSWGHRYVERGDEIVLTHLEHHANIVPWQQLCSAKGARLRVAPVDDTGQVILEEYEKLLNSRTKIVAFTQVSNALGTIVPAKEMIEMAHRWGARVALDGAQAVSHMPVDVQLLDCDFYSFSGHKIFAPTGIGVVYGKKDVLATMPPWQGGGNMIQDVTFEKTTYQPPPGRFEAGTGSIADAVGLGAALQYVSALGLPRIAEHEHELRVYAEGCLAQIRGLRIIGTAPEKAGVISFVLDGQRTEDVGGLLDLEGIAVRSGHHCAQPILRRFGLESTVRASLAPYNTREDVDALVAAVRRLQEGRPGAYEATRERNYESKQQSNG